MVFLWFSYGFPQQLELPGRIEPISHDGTPQPCQMRADLVRAAWRLAEGSLINSDITNDHG